MKKNIRFAKIILAVVLGCLLAVSCSKKESEASSQPVENVNMDFEMLSLL